MGGPARAYHAGRHVLLRLHCLTDTGPAKMFNAPRQAQRYAAAGPVNGLGGSFVDEDPLAISIYDDPWSSAPSPSPPPIYTVNSAFSSVIGNVTC